MLQSEKKKNLRKKVQKLKKLKKVLKRKSNLREYAINN